MRIEDGIFGEYALIDASQNIDDPLRSPRQKRM